jgi:hypothetical protein
MYRNFYARAACTGVFILAGMLCTAQTLKLRPPSAETPPLQITPEELVTMPMSVPAGTPIKVALDSEVRIRKVGQPIHGRTIEPIYTFDKLLIPVGTTVNGKISGIDRVPGKVRTMDAMDGNFSPVRGVHVQFDELVMSDGRHVPIHTVASPAPNGILRFVPASGKGENKNKVQDAASKKVDQAKQQVHQQWSDLQKQLHEPGKLHKLKRLAIAQFPVRPQYMDAGTAFNADLLQPLDFGTESVKPEALTTIGTPPPTGSVVHARLITPLNSATSKKGDKVEAVITQPLVVSDRLILPEGSVISGSVMQVQPARRLARNGQLRILFHEVAPPNGVEQKVVTSLEGVAVAKGEHLKLDTEGGAQVTTPKTRYLTTGIQVALAAASANPDSDAHGGGGGRGDLGGSAVNGASGFRLIGTVVTLAARSRVVGAGFGAYGAANAIYYHFLRRGNDVVYPKDMAMVIGLGTRDAKKAADTTATDQNRPELAQGAAN